MMHQLYNQVKQQTINTKNKKIKKIKERKIHTPFSAVASNRVCLATR
jgi:hypothetical protein